MSSTSSSDQNLMISALGHDPLLLTNALCRACLESRCNIVSSRLTRHNDYCALILQVSGSWDALARLETNLPVLAKRENCQVQFSRTVNPELKQKALPYIIYVSAIYRADILPELCQFLIDHKVTLDTITYDSFLAPQTQTRMLNATLTITLPADMHISWLRDEFLDFADTLNLDAILEPWRPQLT
ncbi:ACT domain-containing protein [Pseudomonas sp. F1_0610]|uniref:glycine cleavage system protein R n=1 Tax=Pseudomonas sp. F1_0610 TaxID=3114284 RepID=UPI0039C38247